MKEDLKREKFIKDLKNKLTQKSIGSVKEEQVFLKAFKYFDLENTGSCSEDNFVKTVLKIGITNYSEDDIRKYFRYYDTNKSGEINYKEFISALYGNKSLGSGLKKPQKKEKEEKEEKEKEKEEENKNQPPQEEYADNKEGQYDNEEQEAELQDPTEMVLNSIREKLASKGVDAICTLAKTFRIVDENNSQRINYGEFKKSCNEINAGIDENEMRLAFGAFDRDKTGLIDYDEFIRIVRGEMNDFRQGIVHKAFEKVDEKGTGEVTFDDVASKYIARRHPDVLSGKKSEDQALKDFMDSFQDTFNYLCGTESDNKITFEEFLEYHENLSMTIEDDKFFEEFMNNVWGLRDPSTNNKKKRGRENKNKRKENEGNERNKGNEEFEENVPTYEKGNLQEGYRERFGDRRPGQSEEEAKKEKKESVLIKFRKEMLKKEYDGFISLTKQFKKYDEGRNKETDVYDFSKALIEEEINLNDDEIKELFDAFDEDKKGTINYEGFVDQARGQMPKIREVVVKEAFSKLDEDKCGMTELNDVKTRVNVNGHKDVKSGEKTEEEVYSEFINSFQMNHDNKVGFRNKKVSLDEFMDYYKNISFYYPDDEDFIYLVQNAWKVNPVYSKVLAPEEPEEISYIHGDLKGKKVKTGAAAAPFGTDVMTEDDKKPKKYMIRGQQPEEKEKKKEKEKEKEKEEEGPTAIENIRNAIGKRGSRGIMSLRRAFKINDADGDGTIDLKEFLKFCHDYRLPLSGKDVNTVFKDFDKYNSGKINYEELEKQLIGEMNNRRKNLIRQLFDAFDVNKTGTIDLDDLREAYDSRNHPDVLSGKSTEDEVLAEFLDTLKYHFGLLSNNVKHNENKISLRELMNYYNNISIGIENDDYFEDMIKGVFNLDERKPKKHGWKSII